MRWRGRQGSGNVSDRRGMGGKLAVGGGLGGIVILIITMLLGGNPLETINVGQQGSYAPSEAENERAQFVGVVLKDTEDVWNALFEQEFNADYQEPTLVLFSQSDQSGCGFASAATGWVPDNLR